MQTSKSFSESHYENRLFNLMQINSKYSFQIRFDIDLFFFTIPTCILQIITYKIFYNATYVLQSFHALYCLERYYMIISLLTMIDVALQGKA